MFTLLALFLFNYAATGQVVQTEAKAQWHFTGYNTTADKYIDWILQVLPTDKKEYIAVGYTTRPVEGVAPPVDLTVPVIMKLDRFGKPVWIKPVAEFKEGSTVINGNLGFGTFYQVIKTPNGYAAAGGAGGKVVLVEVDEAGNFLSTGLSTAFTPAISATQAGTGSYAYCVAMNPAQTEFIVGGKTGYGGVGYAFLMKVNYATRTTTYANTKVYGGTYGTADVKGENVFRKLLIKPETGSGYTIFACGEKSMAGDNDQKEVTNANGNPAGLYKHNKDMWLLKVNQSMTLLNEWTFDKVKVGYNESTLTYPEAGPFSARTMATDMSAAGYCGGCSTPHFLDATTHLKSDVNKDERAFDMTFTQDGKIAMIGLVNYIGVRGYNGGNGGNILRSGIGGVSDPQRSGYVFEEYADGDGFLLQINPDKAISLAQNGQSWQQLSSNYYSALQGIAVKNSFSGFMAAGITDFLGLSPFGWPAPNTNTQQGARPGPGSFAENSNNSESSVALVGISVYPNPTTGALTVTTPVKASISITSLQGQLVATYALNAGDNQLSLRSGIAPGIYIGRVVLEGGRQTLIKIVYQP